MRGIPMKWIRAYVLPCVTFLGFNLLVLFEEFANRQRMETFQGIYGWLGLVLTILAGAIFVIDWTSISAASWGGVVERCILALVRLLPFLPLPFAYRFSHSQLYLILCGYEIGMAILLAVRIVKAKK